MRLFSLVFVTLLACRIYAAGIGFGEASVSVYQDKIADSEAVYFTSDNFAITPDGKTDVSEALQQAINSVKEKYGFGIVFIPSGTYTISRTIYVPQAVRIIGYGPKRPLITLKKRSPGFDKEATDDKGRASYMLWFTGGLVTPGAPIRDAGAGTFYSALSNVDLRIEDGNPHAVALRTHFAQHSFISNVDIYAGNGKAGLYDVGNEMENVRFYGGDYGIYTTKTSPGWQMMMVNTLFEGQRKAAILSQEGGLTIVRLFARNVPTVIEIKEGYSDKIFMEDCVFDNVSGPAVIVSNWRSHANQLSMLNTVCRNVPVLTSFRGSKRDVTAKEMLDLEAQPAIYRVYTFLSGLRMTYMGDDPKLVEVSKMKALDTLPSQPANDIPRLPDVLSWVNVRDLGAVGDGVADDTEAFVRAIAEHKTIYVPQGDYIISNTLTLTKETNLIGLNPISTQLILAESSPLFSGFGSPKPLLEVPHGGVNIVSGIGLNTGAYNYRAVACKWMAGEKSYMNDVKFLGGHGTMFRPSATDQPTRPTQNRQQPAVSSPRNPVAEQGKDRAWDNQYWSLWITDGGGGVFKDIWSASSYAAGGVYISNTSTVGKIYAMSVEHHVRNEARFKGVSNWKVYAMQFEIESREGVDCIELELQDCKDMMFANLYLFRVIRLVTPSPYAVRTWNCENVEFFNVHNFAQVKFTIDLTMYDMNTGLEVRPWEFTHLKITGDEKPASQPAAAGSVERLATGFEFAEGLAADSRGNIYFSEQRMRRIYKWDAGRKKIEMIADYPWPALSLAVDTKDNLLVVFKYTPQPGFMVDGRQEAVPVLPDADGTSFSKWGNSGFATLVYSLDPDNPDETIQLLPRVKMGSVDRVAKALYPSNRWRDSHDFDSVSVYVPEYCFVAPDGVTIIPECYDLARSSSVLEAVPGKYFYSSDEYDRRTVRMSVRPDGSLTGLMHFVERGEFAAIADGKGRVYIVDGEVYVFDGAGNAAGRIDVPERPSSIAIGGVNKDVLYMAARSSLYSINLNSFNK
ncbi:MAG: gluconolaconase [Tannerellaceae bacterium]|jgi:sugar lactone lactonase YvrE|nr:gluconolaconase [Tannerellaceae bacterium]